MLSKIVKTTPQLLSFTARNCRTKPMQLYYKSTYNFAVNVNENPNPQQAIASEIKEKGSAERAFEERMHTFVEYMQKTQAEPNTNYIYNNREIYSVKFQYKDFVARQRGDLLTMLLMLGAGTVSYVYIHPVAVLIPLWFISGSFVSLLGARNMANSLCKSMEVMNQVYVKLRMLSGEEHVCKIEEVEILGLKEWTKAKGTDQTSNYLVLGHFKDIHGKVWKEIKFIVDPTTTRIENFHLFRAIFHKDVKEVEKFELKERILEPQSKSGVSEGEMKNLQAESKK